jgi:hypothetical protein
MLITVDGQTANRLLRIYGITPPVADDRVAGRQQIDAGIPATIDGVQNSQSGRCIRLKIGGHRIARSVPVTENDAATLLNEFTTEQLLPDEPNGERAIVALLVKCSKLYQESGISELHLVLYITPQGYRTHAVYMLRTRNVAIRRRVSSDARPAHTEPM